jgi:hypothetical protein
LHLACSGSRIGALVAFGVLSGKTARMAATSLPQPRSVACQRKERGVGLGIVSIVARLTEDGQGPRKFGFSCIAELVRLINWARIRR